MKTLQYIFYFTSILCVWSQKIGEEIHLQDPKKYPFFAQFLITTLLDPISVEIEQYGATLIHPQWVLTAGHCLPKNKSECDKLINRKQNMIFMGNIYNPEKKELCVKQERRIIKIIRHPKYKYEVNKKGDLINKMNNIAVLKLNKPFKLCKIVALIKLSTSFHKYDYGISINIGGIDFNNIPVVAHIVKYIKLRVMMPWSSENGSKTLFVATSEKGKPKPSNYTLEDDSGGPFIICESKSSPVQFGVLSMVMVSGKKRDKITYLLERIDYYKDFIKKHVPIGKYTHQQKRSERLKSTLSTTKSFFTISYLYLFLLLFMCIV